MTDASRKGEPDTSPALDESDPDLDYEEDEEDEGREGEREESDTCSILSDDSVYPIYESAPSANGDGTTLTFYQICLKNDAKLLQEKIDRGVTREEVMELDINGRVTGLLTAAPKS